MKERIRKLRLIVKISINTLLKPTGTVFTVYGYEVSKLVYVRSFAKSIWDLY